MVTFSQPIKRLADVALYNGTKSVECRFVAKPFDYDPYGALEPPSDLPPALDVQSPGTQHTCMLGLDVKVYSYTAGIEGQTDNLQI